MEKEMFVLAKFKSGDGIFEKFMGWMQSDEGISSGNNPIVKTIFDECIESIQVWELSPVDL